MSILISKKGANAQIVDKMGLGSNLVNSGTLFTIQDATPITPISEDQETLSRVSK